MNEQGLKDIHGPVDVPGDWWWLFYVAAALAVALLVWVLIRFIRKRAMRPAPVTPPIPPWAIALAALALLEKASPVGEEEIKMFYFTLSGIVREYIEARFSIRAPEMTTEEFMERLRHSPALSAEHQDFLNNFLNISDMVKFARFAPSAHDRAEALASARRFVEATRPVTAEASS
ncbi:MAG: DUF4381 family protein [Candidatus Omnitrophica bacterium]|nr:DUF4381 family protein [Candidatus Omnitrophota bacterium]